MHGYARKAISHEAKDAKWYMKACWHSGIKRERKNPMKGV
jgi:hypothetical protein